MTEAGEASGQLDRVYVRLADHFEKEYKQRQKVKGAMTYPIIILIIALFVVVVMVVQVIPTFGKALSGMNVELPKITQVMLNISDFVISYWYVLVLGVIGIIICFKLLSDSQKGKSIVDSIVLKLPLVADVMKTMMTARLSRGLSTMLSSGVLILESLEITQRILGNSVLMKKMNTAIDQLKQGRSLSQTIGELQYFPPLALSMIKTGEEAGNLDETLRKAANFYEDQLEEKIQKLTTFLEPIIMIALGGVVVFILFSVLYPMISVYQSMGSEF
jgi:type IV pilus assembly protein PilC